MSSKGATRSPPESKEVVLVITTLKTSYTHDCDHGFCSVCGSVWPCSRARRATAQQRIPVARTEYYDYA
jgi:hypothetical protein